MTFTDGIKWEPHAKVLKYDPETIRTLTKDLGHVPTPEDLRYLEDRYGLTPDSISEAHGNLLTTAGLNRITNLIIGGGGAALTNAQIIVGVGSSSTAAAVGDTALGGNGASTTAWYQGPDSSNPTQSNGVITCNSTFGTSDGNFAWNEWCWGVGTGTRTAGNTFASVSTSPVLINHKVQSLGTKVSGAIWTLQATITLS